MDAVGWAANAAAIWINRPVNRRSPKHARPNSCSAQRKHCRFSLDAFGIHLTNTLPPKVHAYFVHTFLSDLWVMISLLGRRWSRSAGPDEGLNPIPLSSDFQSPVVGKVRGSKPVFQSKSKS